MKRLLSSLALIIALLSLFCACDSIPSDESVSSDSLEETTALVTEKDTTQEKLKAEYDQAVANLKLELDEKKKASNEQWDSFIEKVSADVKRCTEEKKEAEQAYDEVIATIKSELRQEYIRHEQQLNLIPQYSAQAGLNAQSLINKENEKYRKNVDEYNAALDAATSDKEKVLSDLQDDIDFYQGLLDEAVAKKEKYQKEYDEWYEDSLAALKIKYKQP